MPLQMLNNKPQYFFIELYNLPYFLIFVRDINRNVASESGLIPVLNELNNLASKIDASIKYSICLISL